MKRHLTPVAIIASLLLFAATGFAGTGRVHPPPPPPPLTPAQQAAVQGIVDKSLADYAAKHPTTAPAPLVVTPPVVIVTPPAVVTPTPAAVPAIGDGALRGVWYQPAASLAAWKASGINLAIGYERQANNGVPTVTMPQWDAAARAAGLLRIREPGDPSADSKDATLIGFQQPDELDAAIITAGANSEAIYLAAEQLYRVCKTAAPDKPVYLNFDGEQVRWHARDGQVDYPRLLRCCDRATVDWHPVQRGEAIATYGTILDAFRTLAGSKLVMGLVETSNEELDPRYYKSREPTPDEITAEAKLLKDRGLGIFYFTQRMTEQGHDFRYDNVSDVNRAAMKAINAQ